ncbi:SPOR domain-containing protein [Kiloniella sp. EL199]|uniref:SPOR domain-containing protein n=1 Tax=Kiloniella sp. EL199 TaxID=2107581 RepID=UPI000EA2AE39|nr:SPOR domain-containing protein [Kiloniella sp. EL199]
MTSNSSDNDLKDFEKVRQNESMRVSTDRDAQDIHDEFSNEEYWEDDLDFDDDPGAGLFKKLVPIGLGLIAVAVVGGGILIMLGDNKPSNNIPDAIPLIEAETTPEKTKPESPGGMIIPHQDKLVLNNDSGTSANAQVEKLLPPPEIPQPPKAPEPEVDNTAETVAQSSASETQAQITATEDTAQQSAKKEAEAAKIEEQSLANTGEGSTIPKVPELNASEVESVLAPQSEAEVAKKAETSKAPEPTVSEPTSTTAKKVEPKEAAPTAVAQKPASGQYVLQLASLKSKDGAMTEWKNMQRKLSDLLGSKQPIIEKASISGVGVRYRLQTGPFDNKQAASDFCSKLKAAKRDCLVKKVK